MHTYIYIYVYIYMYIGLGGFIGGIGFWIIWLEVFVEGLFESARASFWGFRASSKMAVFAQGSSHVGGLWLFFLRFLRLL